MKCVVPSQNVKVLAKAFHSLGRIGDDLYIEPHSDHIAFRTVNTAESAYAYFIFSKLFFSSFNFFDEVNPEELQCKIAMKSLLAIFKFPHGDRLIEWCQLKLDSNGTKVIFQMRYSYGCTKTYFLPILDSQTLKANYSKDDCQNRLSATPKLLSTAVKNFRSSESEVTLCVMPQKLIMRNHLDNILDSKKAVRTEISLYIDEFESYNIQAETSITFCLQELKAVLFFAEFTGLPVQFFIGPAGKPVVFVVENESLYEANYVVSTLSESGSSLQLSQMSESSATMSTRDQPNARKRPLDELGTSNGYITPQPKRIDRLAEAPLSGRSGRDQSRVTGLGVDKRIDRLAEASPRTVAPPSGGSGGEQSRVSGLGAMTQSAFGGEHSQFSEPMHATSDTNVTQPVVKAVFPRCFDTTFKKQSLPGYNKVLAYDSDGMEDSD